MYVKVTKKYKFCVLVGLNNKLYTTHGTYIKVRATVFGKTSAVKPSECENVAKK